MSRILGLDLGTASIGWTVIESEKEAILGIGSRVFPEGVDRNTQNKEVSKNAVRTEKRQARRQNFRRKMRKWKLAKVLIEHGMFPDINPVYKELTGEDPSRAKFRKKFQRVMQEVQLPEKLRSFFANDPYEARSKGYRGEKLSLFELGRTFYHFAQRRGYRETLQETDDDRGVLYEGIAKEGKTGIKETKKKIKEYGTLGNYLYHEDSHETRLRNRYTLRSMYENEFNIIWQNQQKYYPDLLTEELRLKIGGSKRQGDKKDGILFYQRPLRSQKHLIANCTFESDKPRSKQSIIPFELFRSYQLVNSIKVDGEPLNEEDRKIALELLNSRKQSQKFSTLRKKLSNPDGSYNYGDKDTLPINNTIYHFRKIFGKDRWNNFSMKEQEEIWHIKYMADDPKWLEQYAREKWSLDDDSIKLLKSFKLKDDYANLSRKAILNILPYLKKGFLYDKAVLLGGLRGAFGSQNWNDMDWETKQEIEEKVLAIAEDKDRRDKTIDQVKRLLTEQYDLPENKAQNLYHHSVEEKVKIKPKLEPPDNVRNPIVQQALYEVRTVVNELIDKYGKPDEIRVELARELKSSKKHREKIRDRQQEREEENIKIKATLDEYGLPHTRHNIHKVKLYNEIKDKAGRAINPYNPEKTIGIEDLLRRDGYMQIEHIIPKSISLDDSLANKTLCDADTNDEKGDQTPYQYFMSQGMSQEEWENYKDRIFNILPFHKAQKFISEKEPELDDFIQRQLNDTRYISKLAKNYLKNVCPKVTVAQGTVTSMLRYYWGLDGILGGKYEVGTLQNGEYLAAVDPDDNIVEIVEWDEETLDKDQKRLEKKGQFLQGNVKNGIFYPFKQRDDHRHHAVDALAVACSETKYLQQISRLSARDHSSKQIKQDFEVEQPWEGFWQDAEEAVNSILVSHKQTDRILTKVKKQLYDYKGNPRVKDGKKLYAVGKAARGQLHNETIYGKHTGKDGKDYYHVRKKLEEIDNSAKVNKIVDSKIRELVRIAIIKANPNIDLEGTYSVPNHAFFEIDEETNKKKPLLYLPNKNGDPVPVKKVRIRERIGNAKKLKDNINQFVDPQNNHHVIVFRNKEEELDEDVLTFWEVVERQKQNQPVYKLPYDGEEIIATLQDSDMFLLGTDPENITAILQDPELLKEHLYYVQSVSSKYYEFRLATDSRSKEKKPPSYIYIRGFGSGKTGWLTHNPVKVTVSPIGEINLADEYHEF